MNSLPVSGIFFQPLMYLFWNPGLRVFVGDAKI